MLLSPLLLRLAAPAARRCRASRRVALVSATASEPEVAAPAPAAAEAAPRAAASAPSSASSSADFDASQVKELLTESAEKLGSAWAETKEKPAVITLGLFAFVGLWAVAGVLKGINALPFVPSLLELVGVVYSAWFVFRYLLYKPDREELKAIIEDVRQRILS